MPPSDSSKAREDTRSAETGTSKPGSSGAPGAPVDEADEAAALLKELTVGSIVDGKYRIDEVLGRGAMGVVVAATHLQLGERVALKFLRYRARAVNDDFQSRFKREARVSARLKNEHITRVIDVGVWRDQVPYMVMDYLTGTDLRQLVKKNGSLPVAQAIDFTVQICVGISEAHAAGIVHRDLKPSNLFLTRRPDGSDLVKILDFGISKWSAEEAEVEELTQTGVVLGSPKYMAPEQLFGSSEVDSRADVWSIGAILYELLIGRPPFDLPTFTKICAELSTDRPPPSPAERRPEITPELEAVVLRCFLRNPDQRIQNVAELAGDLLDAVQAPFAEPMRQKIASTLASKGGRDALSISGGSSPLNPLGNSGTYGSVSGSTSRSGSGRASPASTGASQAVEADVMVPPRRSKATMGILVGGVVVVSAVAYFALAGHSTEPAPASSTSAAAALTVPVSTTTAPSATATATTSASAAPDDSAAATAAQPPRPVIHHGGWRPPPPPPHPTANPPQTSQPVATAAPTPTPTPTPTAKPDPLGDRQ
jgi:eukaryotic-like serine/threonine-protein kinase